MTTKEKILRSALKLFNKKDTKSITTNHIAKEAGISPGNLYYYFENKEEIIRVLYQNMRNYINFENQKLPNTICEMKIYCDFVANIWWDYIFLRKELLFLINRDNILKKEVIEDNKKQYKKLLKLISHLIEKGCIKKISVDIQKYLADTIMIYSQFWTPYLFIMEQKVSKDNAKKLTKQIDMVFLPYLTEKSIKNLKNCN